jgi:hypothetical protein
LADKELRRWLRTIRNRCGGCVALWMVELAAGSRAENQPARWRGSHRIDTDGDRSRMKSIKLVACTTLLLVSQAFSQTKPEATSYLKEAQVSETEGTVHIVANSPRPLQQVLDALYRKYNWAIDYEDARFTSLQDLVDVPDPVTHAPHAQTLPAGGKFTVDFPAVSITPTQPASTPADSTKPASAEPGSATPSARPVSEDEEKSVRLIVEAYNKSDNPGRFEVRKNGQGNLDVVGTAARDAKGQISPQKPILDTRLTVPRRQRTATETIELLCRKLTALRGNKVAIGVNPRNVLDHTSVTVGAIKAEPARDLLWQTLTAAHCNCYLRVVFDPNSKGFYLSIHSIQVPKSVTKGPA